MTFFWGEINNTSLRQFPQTSYFYLQFRFTSQPLNQSLQKSFADVLDANYRHWKISRKLRNNRVQCLRPPCRSPYSQYFNSWIFNILVGEFVIRNWFLVDFYKLVIIFCLHHFLTPCKYFHS